MIGYSHAPSGRRGRRTSHRWLLILALIVLGALLFFHVFSLQRRPKKALNPRQPLVIWLYGAEAKKIDAVIGDFQSTFPEYEVKVRANEWSEPPDRLMAQLPKSEQPDLIQVGSTWIIGLAYKGQIRPLNRYVSSGALDRKAFHPASWPLYQMAGVQYAIPWYLDVRALYYRKDMIPRPPQTWRDVIRLAEQRPAALRDATMVPYVLNSDYSDVNNFLTFFWSQGARLESMGDARSKAAFQDFVRIFQSGVAPRGQVSLDTTHPERLFIEGRIPLLISGPWYVPMLERQYPDMNDRWATTAPPADKVPISFLGGSGWAIAQEAKNPTGAWLFIEYMSNPEQQRRWNQEVGTLPAVLEAWDTGALTSPHYAGFAEALRDVSFPPVHPFWIAAEQSWSKLLQDAVENRVSEDHAWFEMLKNGTWMAKDSGQSNSR